MNEYVPCPKCGSTDIKKVGYTWWGGALGPKMLNHVKCNNCGTTFNGRTGGLNTMKILLYNVVVIIVVILIYVALTNMG